MKKIPFYELPHLISGTRLTFDGDKTDFRLHVEESCNWGGETEEGYNKACEMIDAITYKGEGWQIYAWYDVSGYQYWMKTMEEQNYIQITLTFDGETVNDSEILAISNALDLASSCADEIQHEYNFNPNPY